MVLLLCYVVLSFHRSHMARADTQSLKKQGPFVVFVFVQLQYCPIFMLINFIIKKSKYVCFSAY